MVFHHSLIYRSTAWIWPCRIMNVSFVYANWQVRLQILKNQIIAPSLLQAWYPPKIKSCVLQDVWYFKEKFDPCGSVQTVNLEKYFTFALSINRKENGWAEIHRHHPQFLNCAYSSQSKQAVNLIIYLATTFLSLFFLRCSSVNGYDMLAIYFT